MNKFVLLVCIGVIGLLFGLAGMAYSMEQYQNRDHRISMTAVTVASLLILQVVYFNEMVIRWRIKKLKKEAERLRFLKQQDND
jgi:hypothetical protein